MRDLNPARVSNARACAGRSAKLTFITVNEGILDYHRTSICGGVLLRLPPALAERRIFAIGARRDASRHAEDMARKELFGADQVGIVHMALAVSSVEENVGGGD